MPFNRIVGLGLRSGANQDGCEPPQPTTRATPADAGNARLKRTEMHHNKTPRSIRFLDIARMISQPNVTKIPNHCGGSSVQNSFAANHMTMLPPINIRKSGNTPRSRWRRASITTPTANNTTPTTNASHLRSRSFIISGATVVMPRLFPVPTTPEPRVTSGKVEYERMFSGFAPESTPAVGLDVRHSPCKSARIPFSALPYDKVAPRRKNAWGTGAEGNRPI